MRKLLLISTLLIGLNSFGQYPMTKLIAKRTAVDYFNPNDVSGCLMWVYADTLGLANDDPVSTWTDLSGNGNDATQTSTARPLYKTNIQNGRAVLRFDGSNDFMQTSSTSMGDGLTGMTIFAVVAQSSLAINNAILCKWDYASQGTFAFQTGDASSDELTMYIASSCTSVGSEYQRSTDADLTAAFYILEIVYDGSQGTNANRVKMYRNGTLLSTSTAGTLATALSTCTATLKIGSFGGALSRKYTGDMGEILMYNTALGTTDRDNIRNYLNAHWAVY